MGSSGIAKMGDCLGWRTSLDSFCGILRQIVCETGAILTFTDSCLGPGCAQFQKTANNARKKQWNGVQFGPATYNQWTHDFEEPWPWGPEGGP
jgi:hypothetical protein